MNSCGRTFGRAGLRLLFAVPVGLILACGSEEAPIEAPAAERRDSAGIEIVEVAADAWGDGEGWRVGSEPLLVIGQGTRPDQELYRVRGAVRLSDGRVAVANAGTQEIRFFGPDGAFLYAAGGEGEGPGEFQSLFGLGRRGDTLVAHDYMARRLTSFDAGGDMLGTTAVSYEGLPFMRLFPTRFGAVGLQLGRTQGLPEEYEYVRRLALYHRFDRDGGHLGPIDELAGMEMLYRGRNEGNVTYVMSTSPLIAHQQHETVVGERLVAGITDRFEIRIYAPDGALERLIRAPSRERGVTPEEWDRAMEEELQEREDTPEARSAVAELAELAPPPEVRPVFGRFVADREGYVWVAPYRPETGPTVSWLVVDLEGPILGTVDLPRGFTPTEIGSDYVLGTVRDEMDVETVRLFALTR
jgi:hypothetical protein